MILEKVLVDEFQENCYILGAEESHKAIIIDPGGNFEKIERKLKKRKLSPAFIVNTHGHVDHIREDQAFGVPIYIHVDDLKMLGDPELNLSKFFTLPVKVDAKVKTIEDNQEISLDRIRLKVIHTPGHTPGGICLLLLEPKDKILFSGDTLFYSSIGRSDLPGGSGSSLIDSIKNKLFTLDDSTVVYPGHGQETSIGWEKQNNFFLK